MKLKYLRWIDRYIGIVACFVFHAFKHLWGAFSWKRNAASNNTPLKILVIKFWGFGSITLAFDFFQLIRKNFPNSYLCAVTLKQNRSIYEITGLFDEMIDIEISKLPTFLLNSIRVLYRLRKLSFDIAFDLEFTSRLSAMFTYLTNAKKRFGFKYHGVWRGDCFTDTLDFKEDEKLKKSFLGLARLAIANAKQPSGQIRLAIKDSDSGFVNSLFKEERLIGVNPLIGVNINASELCLLRRWPIDYFISLVEELIKKYSAHIVFVGGKYDVLYVANAIGRINSQYRKMTHDFSGRINLTQLAYLLSKLSLFISNDSGPLHLAVYIGTPTVSFFGPETPLIYGPEGNTNLVFYKELNCSPCIRIKNYKHTTCVDSQRCLWQIKPAEVISEIERKRILR